MVTMSLLARTRLVANGLRTVQRYEGLNCCFERQNGALTTIRHTCRTLATATESAFKEHQVVPDVLSSAPPSLVHVAFDQHKAALGNVLTPTIVQRPPTKLEWPATPGKLYTLCKTGTYFIKNIDDMSL